MRKFLILLLLCTLPALAGGLTSQPEAAPTPKPSPAAQDLEGVWSQHILSEGKLYYLCEVTLKREGDAYRATTTDVAEIAWPKEIKTYEHRLQGEVWTFGSDWKEQGQAQFRLTRKGPDRFEGHAYLNGKVQSGYNVWTRQ